MKVTPAALKKVGLLKEMTDDQLLKLTSRMKYRRFTDKQEIFSKGAASDSVFIIINGKAEARIFSGEAGLDVSAHLGEGEIFGQVSLLGKKPRTAACSARGAVLTAELNSRALDELLEDKDPGAAAFLLLLTENLAKQIRQSLAGVIKLYDKLEKTRDSMAAVRLEMAEIPGDEAAGETEAETGPQEEKIILNELTEIIRECRL